MAIDPHPITVPISRIAELRANVEKVIRGKTEVVEFSIAAILARGHILFEDVPGVGKTTLAQALARSLSLSFHRVQFTSDLLPSDIIGVTVFNQDHQEFEFISGPVFTNVLLADEINRASPKTQSALLEAMNEGTVTVEKDQMPLPDPFLVMATQNPVEHAGTYPLPESQLDRFLMRLHIGYPGRVDEKQIIRDGGAHAALEQLTPILEAHELAVLQTRVPTIHATDALVDYLMTIIDATRNNAEIAVGVSTRGALTYFKACQALAMVEGRDFVIPDDVKRLAVPVLAHRIALRDRRVLRGDFTPEAKLIQRIVAEIPIPR